MTRTLGKSSKNTKQSFKPLHSASTGYKPYHSAPTVCNGNNPEIPPSHNNVRNDRNHKKSSHRIKQSSHRGASTRFTRR
jgi:hypothetical protein